MENKEIVSIPFVAHESDMNRMERINKRLNIIVIIESIIILLMFIGIMIYFYLPSEAGFMIILYIMKRKNSAFLHFFYFVI